MVFSAVIVRASKEYHSNTFMTTNISLVYPITSNDVNEDDNNEDDNDDDNEDVSYNSYTRRRESRGSRHSGVPPMSSSFSSSSSMTFERKSESERGERGGTRRSVALSVERVVTATTPESVRVRLGRVEVRCCGVDGACGGGASEGVEMDKLGELEKGCGSVGSCDGDDDEEKRVSEECSVEVGSAF